MFIDLIINLVEISAILLILRVFLINILGSIADYFFFHENWSKAIKFYRYVLLLKSKDFEVYNRVGNAFAENNELETSIVYYQKSIELNPLNYQSFKNLALVYLDQAKHDKALIYFQKSLRLKHGLPFNENSQNFFCQEIDDTKEVITGKHKIKHDIEQLEYLLNKNKLPEVFEKVLSNYQSLYQGLEEKHNKAFLITLKGKQKELLEETYDRNLYLESKAFTKENIINPVLTFSNIEEEYLAKNPEVIYFDDFLTEDALNHIREFCLSSTIWHEYKRSWGYLASYMDNGFNSEFLFDLSKNIKEKFPKIFKNYNLMNIWAFKYDSTMSGVSVHADEAMVNLNFWITIDSANLDKNSGGLVVYDKPAPLNWSFEEYNADTNAIYNYLKKQQANKIVIPYKENRAVIFNSALFHETDKYHFKEGYENRRINVTLLFGKRICQN